MSYEQTAQSLASLGRYGDSMLMHVTPQEVSGLQALARLNGTSLTINPQTGMPEAFSLGDLLPTLAGAAISAFVPGASPLMAGLITGGLGALMSGDIKQGLLSGLGGAGGASLAGSLANLASPAATAATGAAKAAGAGATAAGGIPVAPLGATASGQTALSSPLIGGATNAATAAAAANPVNLNTIMGGAKTLNSLGAVGNFLGDNKLGLAMSAAPLLGSAFKQQPGLTAPESYLAPYELDIANRSGQGSYSPEDSREQQMLEYNFRALPRQRVAQGGLISMAEGGAVPPPNTISPGEANVYSSIQRAQYLSGMPMLNMRGFNVQAPNRASVPTTAAVNANPAMDSSMIDYNVAVPQAPKPPPPPNPAQNFRNMFGRGIFGQPYSPHLHGWAGPGNPNHPQYFGRRFVEGGLTNLPRETEQYNEYAEDYAEPRYLSGDGDGMSDSIPAMIEGEQPAQLADGEFVIPADVVSHLGNGSSEAGAEVLYEMMNRIRMARTGDDEQAPAIDARTILPA